MSNWISVNMEDYLMLLSRIEKLDALEAAGVDNWEGYDEVMRELHAEDDEED
jgi:hypothetical protein